MLGDSKYYVRAAGVDRGIKGWRKRLGLRRRKSVETGVPTHQISSIMNPLDSQESIELFAAETKKKDNIKEKKGYKPVGQSDEEEGLIIRPNPLDQDPTSSNLNSGAETKL